MGLSRVDELEAKYSELEKLYQETVQARDEAIEERNRATVVLAFQLEKETAELANHIEDLNKKNTSILDENEDLSIKLEFARRDLQNLQKKHIKLQLESEQHICERDNAIEKVNEFEKKNRLLKEEVDELLVKLNNTRTTSESNSNNSILIHPTITITNCCSVEDKRSGNIDTKNHNENESSSKNDDSNLNRVSYSSESKSSLSSTNNQNNNSGHISKIEINSSPVERKSTSKENNSICYNTKSKRSSSNNDRNSITATKTKNRNDPVVDISLHSLFDKEKGINHNISSETIGKDKERNKASSDRNTNDVMNEEPKQDSRLTITLKKNAIENEYDVHEELGKGKFGVVRRVTSKSSKDVYAAKYIKTSPSAAGSSRDEVLREIDIMSRLNHKRLVGLLDAYEIGKMIIMIMEFVSGGELFERVVDEDCLTEKEAAYYMHQILEGLQHMHVKNILHLDLKPENIVCVSKDSWEIKLIDFGLAQELIPGTKMKAMKGTPEFMAPETVNFDPVSKPADMWSVGVIAYILLSGLSPFMGDDNNETLSNVNAAEWDFDDEAFDVISDEAKEFISQLLIKDPKNRNTVESCLEHEWMKKSESANAVKIDTKKLKQFLAKRRWQKSVNALVAVRRLSSMSNLLGINKSRPSIAPMLANLSAAEEGEEEKEEDESEKEEKSKSDKKENDLRKVKVKQNDSNKPVQVNGTSIVDQTSRAHKNNHFQKKPAFIKELDDVTVSEGDSVTMEVTINGDARSDVEWYFDGGEVNEREGVTIVNHGDGTHAIIIDECEEEDTGEYSCVFETDAGKAITRGYLTVEVESNEESGADIDPPVFNKELTDMTAKEGETATMEVDVSGEDYQLEWFKNAVDIVEGGRLFFTTNGEGKHALVITNVEDDDTGEYCCVAQNDGGRNTCAGYFMVAVEGEDDEDEEDESEEETDEELYEEKDIEIKKEYIEDFYAIEEEIGRGRFGIARKCVHISTGIHFVAKFIKARPSQKDEFKREIDVMNTLRHPSLCRLREAFEKPRELVIVMEYNRGGDLLQRISESPMSEPDSVEILRQLLEALNYMHGNKFMHLDVKPENVMFKREGGNMIRLIDFSLARKYDPKVETKISQGTAEYVAPEIVSYDSVSPATDMWAVGITSYMMLSGISPFLSESEAETFANITHCKWSFTEVFNDVGEEAKELITKLLVKEKSGRLNAGQCLEHPWIMTVGLRGKKERVSTLSHTTSLSDISNSLLTNGDLHESISSVESYLRLNSTSDDVFVSEEDVEKKHAADTRELEATLQTFLLKLREVESERAELEEKVKASETKTESLQQKLDSQQRGYTETISNLQKENEKYLKQVKSKNELLVKIGDLETLRKELEEKLEEKNRSHESMEEKYDNMRTKMEQYDMLEEKMYRYEREKKENLLANKRLQEKLEESKAIEKDLKNKQLENENKKSQEISKIMNKKEEIEEKYNKLVQQKEKLVSELTEKLKVLEQKKNESIEQKEILEKKVKDLEKENRAVEEDLKRKSISSLEKEKKKTADICQLRKEKDEIDEKYTKLRQEKENLVSELKKKFAIMEKDKKNSFKQNEILEKKVKELENELKKRTQECTKLKEEMQKSSNDVERLSKMCLSAKEFEANISALKEEKSELEKEGNNLRKQKEDAQKTCEELASKLSKLYGEVEKLKSLRDQTMELEKLKNENQETKKNLDTAEEKCFRLQSELQSCANKVSDLQRELRSVQNSVELNNGNPSDSNIETLKTTILDLEATILTHKSTIAVSKGEIDLLQEKLAVEHEEKAQLMDELTDKKRELHSLSAKLAKTKAIESKTEKKQQDTGPEKLETLKQETKRLLKEKEEIGLLLKTQTVQKEAVDKELALLREEKQQFDNNSIIALRQEVQELQTLTKKLSKQKEELSIGITLRDKKIKLYENEIEELQKRKTQSDDTGADKVVTQNGITEKSNKEVEELRDQLRKAKQKSAATEAELQQLKSSYQTKLKAEQEEMENKWTKRLRKECSELQTDLAKRYAQEKRLWLKKENELQNMIRQMKVLLDKRTKEAAEEKKRLENKLPKAKAFQESTASLDSGSISDDIVDGGSSTPCEEIKKEETSFSNNNDALNDRDLRRVAYKLTNDEWSQLGTFLGVADTDLHKMMGLNMGPQEKAFRLLGIWRTQSTLGKNQLVSQLAVALEEINRKDLAQFVVEQMMSGKPRKKFFGW